MPHPKPQALIRARAEGYRDTAENRGVGVGIGAVLDQMADDFDRYEADQGITYLAVPTGALQRLRSVWETGAEEYFKQESPRLVRDVFDGQDGHLLRIDHALMHADEPDLPMDMGRGQQRAGQ